MGHHTYAIAIILHTATLSVLCLSPRDFQHYYKFLEGPQIEDRPSIEEKPFFGYIAPTERPSYKLPSSFHKTLGRPSSDRINDKYSDGIFTRPISFEVSRYPIPTRDQNTYSVRIRPTIQNNQQKYSGIDFGSTDLEHVQNLVHLRNLHSLEESTNAKRKIPYGYIRNGKEIQNGDPINSIDSTSRSWAAHAVVSDQHGEESLIIERGIRYRGPHPSTEIKSRYASIEIDNEPLHGFRDRRSYIWNTDATENSITKRPMNTILRPNNVNERAFLVADLQGEPSSRSVLFPLENRPITFRTKVTTSLGVEPDLFSQPLHFGQSNILVSPEPDNHLHSLSQQSTTAQVIEPLASPPVGNSQTNTFSNPISTTAQNEQQAVLPSPQDFYAQAAAGTTQPSYGISSYGSSSGSPSPYGMSGGPSSYGMSGGPSTNGQVGGPSTNRPSGGPSTYGQTGGPSSYGQTGGPSTYGQSGGPSTYGQTGGPSTYGRPSARPSTYGHAGSPSTHGQSGGSSYVSTGNTSTNAPSTYIPPTIGGTTSPPANGPERVAQSKYGIGPPSFQFSVKKDRNGYKR